MYIVKHLFEGNDSFHLAETTYAEQQYDKKEPQVYGDVL